MAPKPATPPAPKIDYSALYASLAPLPPPPSSYGDSINISIAGLNSMNPKIDIKNNRPAISSHYSTCNLHSHSTASNTNRMMINTLSSYDFPNQLTSSSCSSAILGSEDILLKSIQESQEKLRLANKLEKTTDIVDDIVSKVKVLQAEMKKRSTALELQNEIEQMRKSREALLNISSNSLAHVDDHCHCHLHNQHLHHDSHPHRSRSIEKLNTHVHHIHHHPQRSNSRHRLSRNTSPVSILKSTEILTHTHPTRKRSVSFHRSSSSGLDESLSSLRRSSERLNDYRYIAPKVNSWNFVKPKHDQNIY